jgi:polysaccharide pyruvyl transferase WcaK-like protein
MKKLMFIGNGDYRNNGCEAITRGSLNILRQSIPDCEFIDSYFLYDKNEKRTFLGNDVETKPVFYPKRWTFKWFVLQVVLRFFDNKVGDLLYSSHNKYIDESDAILSLGGDNYSLDYGVPKRFLAMGDYIKKRKKPFIIWGASIGPFTNEEEFERNLIKHYEDNVDLIFVREEESYNYLLGKGLKKKTYLIADPAFMMKPTTCSKEEIGFELPKEFIALNFSELMSKYVTNNDLNKWKDICNESVESIYEKYNLPIVLIPHVSRDKEFMEDALSSVMKKYQDIKMINNTLDAAQMKWIISKAKCLVAARTHATIAGFSTAVPTLSLGYSIKARGLNRLLFNSEEYLLYCDEITTNNIVEKIRLIIKTNTHIKQILIKENLKMKTIALKAGKVLKIFLKDT